MKQHKKRILGILLSFALMLTMMPGMSLTAYAQDEVKYLEGAWDETAGKCLFTEKGTDSYTVVDANSTAWGAGTYVVNSEVTISGRITVNGTVNLILCDGATLTASSGITVSNGNTLNIYGQKDGTGILAATAYVSGNGPDSSNGAAIGGLSSGGFHSSGSTACGTINIHGGTVNANKYVGGDCYAAGIGGAGMPGSGGNGGAITVYSGTVNAYGNSMGAGIGSSYWDSSGGSFTMYGGTVTAVGGSSGGGGISGGGNRSGTAVTAAIYGGTVTATGGKPNNTRYHPGDGIGYGPLFDNDTYDHGTLTLGTGVTLYGGTSANPTTEIKKIDGKYARYQYMKTTYCSHTHDFSYSVSDATITAACSEAGCDLPPSTEGGNDHVAKLTIAAPESLAYDGNPKAATITDENSIQGDAKVMYQKKTDGSYGTATETAPTDSGDYKASITLGEATASVEYTIAKADPTANAPTGLTATYGQTLSDVTLTNPAGNTDGTWAWVAAGTTSVGNAGDNTFKANFTPTDAANYNSVEDVDVKITVGKAANPATVTSAASVKVGGSKVDLAQNVSKNGATGAVTYAISGEAQGCSISGSELTSGANTGSVTVNVTVAEDDNYNASAAMQITVTITSKDTQTITADDVTVAYGETGKKIEASTSGDGALSYEVKEGGEYIDVDKSTGMLTVKKPGSAIVTVTAAETSSYAEATKDVNVTATKGEPTAAAVTANNRKYDGTKKPLVKADESILSGGTMQYALGKDDKTAPDKGWGETIPSAAEKGTYYVWYMVKGDDPYGDSLPVCVTVKISEKSAPTPSKVSGTQTARMTAGKKSMTIAWNKIQGADGYDIFFGACNSHGKSIACKNVKNIKGNKTFKWTKSGLKKNTSYKAYVKAYTLKNGKKTYVRTSPMLHAYTGNASGKYTNAKSVTVNKTKVSLKKGKTFKIKAKVNKLKKNKKLMPKSHVATLRYLTSNSKVATVSKSGKITAKGKGTCYIYAFAHNGVSKQVKITVNE